MTEHLRAPAAPPSGAPPAQRPGRRQRFVVLRYFAEFLPVGLGTALFFAFWDARERGSAPRTAGDWARFAGAAVALAAVLLGAFLLLLLAARMLGLRSEEEWATERTPERASAHRWRMLVVWGMLAIAALVAWLAPTYH